MVAFCDDPLVLGTDFYVMKRVPGLVPRRSFGAALDASAARRLCLSFVDTFVALHRVDPQTVGLDTLGKGAGYARRQVAGWTERYANARTWNVPRFSRVTAWLAERVPDDAGSCVIHNDFRLDNLVLDPEDPARVLAVLDWEMATVGDPLMDLGCTLAYWVESGDDPIGKTTRRQPTHLPGMLSRRELCEAYLEKAGRPAQDLGFYEVFGLFRLAAIAQQIYFRYHRKETRNPAFRRFWMLVHYLEWRCLRLMRRSRT
jgi:aminoglycoside phosphotransferase (APT) family kinase protein